jgi:hypothetical protein
MAVLTEGLVHLLGGWRTGRHQYGDATRTRNEHRELAGTMRRLPGRYADRLQPRTLERITAAAAAGQWEKAVEQLIAALRSGAERVTPQERDQLRALLEALNLPSERADPLILRRSRASTT